MTKSQKPRPERWPLTDPSLPPGARASNAANKRTTACRQPLRNAASKRPTARRQIAFEVDRLRVASFLRRSPRQVDQVTWPERATVPEQGFGLQPSQLRLPAKNYLQFLALKSLQPWPQLWPNALKVVTAVGQSSSVRRPPAKPKRVMKLWAHASAAANFTRLTLLQLNSLQLQRSASD